MAIRSYWLPLGRVLQTDDPPAGAVCIVAINPDLTLTLADGRRVPSATVRRDDERE